MSVLFCSRLQSGTLCVVDHPAEKLFRFAYSSCDGIRPVTYTGLITYEEMRHVCEIDLARLALATPPIVATKFESKAQILFQYEVEYTTTARQIYVELKLSDSSGTTAM